MRLPLLLVATILQMAERMALKSQYARLLSAVAITVAVSLAVRISVSPRATTLNLLMAANALSTSRTLYAVNQSSAARGSVSVYDIDRGYNLLKTIPTVSNVDDVKGVAVNAATGKLYVAYRSRSGVGMIFA